MFGRSQVTDATLRKIFLTAFLGAWTLLLYTSEYALASPNAPLAEKSITSTHASLPIATTSTNEQVRGHVVFEHSFFDFGTVTEGDIVKHTFRFKNDGLGKVKIGNTETSCGCTTASAALKEYESGEAGEMEVVVDTKGKKGIIVKTVTLTIENNDVEKVEISLAMKLEPPPHPMILNVRNINLEAACKGCHLESGEGQSGIFLFHRVCSQCHGKKGVGGFGLALNDAKWQKVDDAHIKKVIKAGVADKFMPSFVDGVTPPLTEEQVDSLVQYIRSLVQH
jgi:hypothetical protein